jgi:deazaflavin-dependent oxidoreductase (nitroreductase family)
MLHGTWYRLVAWAGVNRLSRVLHHRLYRVSGGWGPLGRSLGNLTVILITIGARSGRQRPTALWAFPDAADLVVVASNGGRHRLPAWCHNLRAHPEAEVLILREQRAVRAREASGAEYERLWAMVTRAYPGYVDYLARAGRDIPLVVLEARPGEEPATDQRPAAAG